MKQPGTVLGPATAGREAKGHTGPSTSKEAVWELSWSWGQPLHSLGALLGLKAIAEQPKNPAGPYADGSTALKKLFGPVSVTAHPERHAGPDLSNHIESGSHDTTRESCQAHPQVQQRPPLAPVLAGKEGGNPPS